MSFTELRTCPYCGTPDHSGDIHILDFKDKLQPKEWNLLELLHNNAGKFVPNERLYFAMWGADAMDWPETYQTYLNVKMVGLRKTLKNSPFAIETQRGVRAREGGYRLVLKDRKKGIYYNILDENGFFKPLHIILYEIGKLAVDHYGSIAEAGRRLDVPKSSMYKMMKFGPEFRLGRHAGVIRQKDRTEALRHKLHRFKYPNGGEHVGD